MPLINRLMLLIKRNMPDEYKTLQTNALPDLMHYVYCLVDSGEAHPHPPGPPIYVGGGLLPSPSPYILSRPPAAIFGFLEARGRLQILGGCWGAE